MTPVQHPGDLRWETRLITIITATLTVFGVVTVYGAASYQNDPMGLALRQGGGALAGLLFMTIGARIDYRLWRRAAWPLLFGALLVLLIPLLPFTRGLSSSVNGARRWVALGPLSFQPSEVAKFTIVVWVAMLAAKKGEVVRQFKKGVLPFLVVIGAVSLLVLLEPDLSMATLVALLGGIVLFTAGAKIGHFLLLGLAALSLLYYQVSEVGYRLARWTGFLTVDDAGGGGPVSAGLTQIRQSLIGVGSGGPVGVGFGEGQLKMGHLPYAYSDFLFSTIGEEWGFVGILLIAGLFALFCWMGFRIARTAPDPFGQFLATGLTASIGVSAFLHMAVTLGLMPTTGLTLPFMSYGRTSLMMSLCATGVLLAVGNARGRPAGSRA